MFYIENSILEVLNKLKNHGETYISGGYLRDKVIGIKPSDVDIVTCLPIEKVMEIFPRLNGTEKGLNFGVGRFQYKGILFEIASYPDSNLDEIKQTRDFTINGLFHDGKTFIDPLDGLKDIENNLIRTTLPYDILFFENPQRYIRAIRLSSVLGFEIEENLKNYMKKNNHIFFDNQINRLQNEGYKFLLSDFILNAFHYFNIFNLVEKEKEYDTHFSLNGLSEQVHIRLAVLMKLVGKNAVLKFLELFSLSSKLEDKSLYLFDILEKDEIPQKPLLLNEYLQIKQFLLKNNPDKLQELYKKLRG